MEEERFTYEDFKGIIHKLRSPEGCPWDREQTHSSLKNCMIEEAYEVVDAIHILEETGKGDHLCEELGDVLMQVFLHSEIAGEEGLFTLEDVVDGISRKMIYRHPHVFGEVQADSSQQVLQNWDRLKEKEKGNPTPEEEIAAVPHSLPALLRTAKVLKKMERYYGAFQNAADSQAEVREALAQTLQEGDPEKKKAAAGETLLQLVNLFRLLDINSEEALTEALERLLRTYEIPE